MRRGQGRAWRARAWRPPWAVVVALAVIAMGPLAATGGPVGVAAAEGGALPDLTVEALYNVTEVYAGEDSYFNVTVKNEGTVAYQVSTSGELDIYAYRDSESEVAVLAQVRENIYIGKSVTVNLKVRYTGHGQHSLCVVLDEMDRIPELNEENNEATCVFDVIDSGVNHPPHADGGNDRTGYKGQPMLFSGAYSSDPDGDPLTYTWDFGDGNTGSGMRTNHTYAEVGDYRAWLEVSDGEDVDRDNFTVHVTDAPVNALPQAVISVSGRTVGAGIPFALDGTGSSDPDPGDNLVMDWDLDASDGVDDWLRGPTVTAMWSSAGDYTVTLRVSDGKASAQATVVITVTAPPPPNAPPLANAGPDITVTAGTTITMAGSGQDPDGSIDYYEWDVDGDDLYDTYSEDSGELRWTFSTPGSYTLRLRVADDRGAMDVDTAMVIVTGTERPPGEGKGAGVVIAGTLAAVATVLVLALLLVRGRRGKGPS